MGNLYEMDAISRGRQASAPLLEKLTLRQLDVLALLCEGLPNKQIGRRLNIASATVKIHVAHILRALNVSSRLQAVIAARSFGLDLKSGNAEPMQRETVTAPRYPIVLRLLLGDDAASRMLAAASDRWLAAAAG